MEKKMYSNNQKMAIFKSRSKFNLRIARGSDGKWRIYRWDDRGRETERVLPFNQRTVEKFFAEHGFTCPYTRENKDAFFSKEVENHETPYMAVAYYNYLYERQCPPTLDQMVEYYFGLFCQQTRDGRWTFKANVDSNPIVFERSELVGRISRSYNSYNRELHLLLSLGEKKGIDAEYDLRDDLYKGIDLSVWRVRDDRYFGIASFVDTKSSNSYKYDVKNTSRHTYEDEVLDVKASLDPASEDCFIISNVVLHSQSCIDKLVKRILTAA